MFSEHITICRTLSIDIWELKCQQRQTNKAKYDKLCPCKLCKILKFFFLILLSKAILETKVVPTNRNSSAFLLNTNMIFSNVVLFSNFSQTFFETNFRQQNKNKSYWNNQLFCWPAVKKRYCGYYVSEHLKYCSQINKYWLHKKMCIWT